MQNINIYDIEAERLEKYAEANDITVAELVEIMCEYLDDIIDTEEDLVRG